MELERTIFLNKLIKDNKYEYYLEIGLGSGKNFKGIDIAYKVAIDPYQEASFKMSSDIFFIQNDLTFDIVFVDGLHLYEQVLKDVENSIKCLNTGGIIVIHDCLPEKEINQLRERKTSNWQGDVWKAIVLLRKEGYKMQLYDIETGIVTMTGEIEKTSFAMPDVSKLNFDWYKNNFRNIF